MSNRRGGAFPACTYLLSRTYSRSTLDDERLIALRGLIQGEIDCRDVGGHEADRHRALKGLSFFRGDNVQFVLAGLIVVPDVRRQPV